MKQIDFLQLAAQLQSSGQAPAVVPTSLKRLNITARKETTHHLRDGEVVLYLRSDSKVWQMRYKLSDRQWHCVSTRQRRLEWAMRVAGEHYDRARFREEEGLPQKTRRFDTVARECCKALEQEIERGIRRETNKDYIRTINKYLVPFFGKFVLSNITIEKVREDEQWRSEQMGRVPISSTLATHASAYSMVVDYAIEQGWLSDRVAFPKLNRKGKKGLARAHPTDQKKFASLALGLTAVHMVNNSCFFGLNELRANFLSDCFAFPSQQLRPAQSLPWTNSPYRFSELKLKSFGCPPQAGWIVTLLISIKLSGPG